MLIRALIILILSALIFGGAALSVYELYWKPMQLDEADRQAALHAPPPTPPPDYSIPIYQKAAALERTKPDEARNALASFIATYPQSTVLQNARQDLGNLNMASLMSSTDKSGKTVYVVKHGDSLVKVAAKCKTNPDLIFRVNDLGTINLSVDDQLLIPDLDISVVVDRKTKTVTLFNHNVFLKEYQTLSLRTPAVKPGAPLKTKVNDKIALSGTERVAFGNRK
jgi:hypothetical protein